MFIKIKSNEGSNFDAKLIYQFEDGLHILTCKEVPGFLLASQDLKKVYGQVVVTAKALLDLNKAPEIWDVELCQS